MLSGRSSALDTVSDRDRIKRRNIPSLLKVIITDWSMRVAQ